MDFLWLANYCFSTVISYQLQNEMSKVGRKLRNVTAFANLSLGLKISSNWDIKDEWIAKRFFKKWKRREDEIINSKKSNRLHKKVNFFLVLYVTWLWIIFLQNTYWIFPNTNHGKVILGKLGTWGVCICVQRWGKRDLIMVLSLQFPWQEGDRTYLTLRALENRNLEVDTKRNS